MMHTIAYVYVNTCVCVCHTLRTHYKFNSWMQLITEEQAEISSLISKHAAWRSSSGSLENIIHVYVHVISRLLTLALLIAVFFKGGHLQQLLQRDAFLLLVDDHQHVMS